MGFDQFRGVSYFPISRTFGVLRAVRHHEPQDPIGAFFGNAMDVAVVPVWAGLRNMAPDSGMSWRVCFGVLARMDGILRTFALSMRPPRC